MNPKNNIAGVLVDNTTYDVLIDDLVQCIKLKTINSVFTPNIDIVVKAHENDKFKVILNESNFVVADGKPLVWASRYLRQPLLKKISGSTLFFKICKLAQKNRYRIFLLGAADGVAAKAKVNIERDYPGAIISGTYSPPLGFEYDLVETNKINQLLKDSMSDILIVGLGAPKQEYFISNNKDKYQIPVSLGLGASIDFAAGIKKMPPEWIKEIGLGWLWRLLEEPKRLWRRYLLEDSKFFWLIFKQKRLKNKRITLL